MELGSSNTQESIDLYKRGIKLLELEGEIQHILDISVSDGIITYVQYLTNILNGLKKEDLNAVCLLHRGHKSQINNCFSIVEYKDTAELYRIYPSISGLIDEIINTFQNKY